MAQTFKVTALSPKTKQWKGNYGPMVDYYVKLEGVDAPVIVTKKPDSRPPAAGDELFGTLDMSGKFGPKFKAEKQAFGGGGTNSFSGGGGSKPSYQPKDEASIHAQFAIREANLQVVNGLIEHDALEQRANDFYDMIERVKSHASAETKDAEPDKADKKPDLSELDDLFGKSDTIPTDDEVPFP